MPEPFTQTPQRLALQLCEKRSAQRTLPFTLSAPVFTLHAPSTQAPHRNRLQLVTRDGLVLVAPDNDPIAALEQERARQQYTFLHRLRRAFDAATASQHEDGRRRMPA